MTAGRGERGGLWRVLDGGPLRQRVTRAGASEPGWQLCVTSDSGHSKFRVLREPGLSDSESGHRVRV